MTAIVRLAVILVTVGLLGESVLQVLARHRDLAILFALAAPLGISAWGFARAGHNEVAVVLLCAVLTTVVTLDLVLSPLGVRDGVRTAYGGIVLMGALLLSRRAFYGLAAVAAVGVATAYIVDIYGLGRSNLPRAAWLEFAEFILLIGMFGVLGRAASEILFGSLGAAHRAGSDDALTGFANRQAFFEKAARQLKAMQPNRATVLVLCDLQGFRRINIVVGHRAADSVLREVARRIRDVDPHQFVGRIGDDEFAIIASVDNDEAAWEYAMRLHQILQFDYAGISVRTATGFARSPRDARSLESLLLAAEGSLTTARQHSTRFAEPADRP